MSGSWEVLGARQGGIEGSLNTPRGLVYELTADATDGSVPSLDIDGIGGLIFAVDVEFGDTQPSGVSLSLATEAGVSLISSEAFSATGRYTPDTPIPVSGNVVFSVSGNSTNSATAKLVIYLV